MKKIFIIIIILVTIFCSILYLKKDNQKVMYKKVFNKKIENDIKLKEYHINKENSNIEELFKENIKYTYKINYDCIKDNNVKIIEEVNNPDEEITQNEETKEEIKNGFIKEDNNTYFYENGVVVTGFKTIDNNNYFFDENGIMIIDSFIDKLYFDSEGKQVYGFYEIDNNKYYFNEEGYVVGFNEIDNNKYYFNENGIMQRGIVNINGTNYLFDENGILVSGYKKDNNKTYFYNENNNKLLGLNIIEGKRNYFDFKTGELIKEDVKSIIDISYWQGNIDWDKVKESNLIDGVIVRIGYGTSRSDKCVLDKKFKRNIDELNRLNIPYGIYLYGYAQTEYAAKKEAEFVLDNLNKYNVNLSYPVFYDAEITNYKGVFYSKDLYEKVITTFINEFKKNNITAGVYGNLYMLSKGSLNSSLIKSNPIWVAQYYNICQYDEPHIGWQYSSKGSIPGINGNVDLNIFY